MSLPRSSLSKSVSNSMYKNLVISKLLNILSPFQKFPSHPSLPIIFWVSLPNAVMNLSTHAAFLKHSKTTLDDSGHFCCFYHFANQIFYYLSPLVPLWCFELMPVTLVISVGLRQVLFYFLLSFLLELYFSIRR